MCRSNSRRSAGGAAGAIATERDRSLATSPAVGREHNSDTALALAAYGMRSSVVRLPRSVHGRGDAHRFVSRLIARARERGVAGYVGNGDTRCPAVHVADAAWVYRLALEDAPSSSVLHAVGHEAYYFL